MGSHPSQNEKRPDFSDELCTHHSFSTVSGDSMLHVIKQEHCLHCRNCLEVSPSQIEKQSIYIEMETERKR